ncbi:nicotinate (nicotinamide) nucleotide adenylyltransferase [Limnobacter humi]|uniref:Probable nicotinate-nucleotide adenylyltransferase n=1 Tax=Limnobacter humi TaxID=1778671 RepID=A0ABT1WC80_9BURK|nr:nicotinate (nicotinamide) nucleotide adenylyltransferase [Limnobacter humi]MCQ8895126.1 nicotinate (nicotinamide) nucleotide adenylyltransferase [Limnobacter humi]
MPDFGKQICLIGGSFNPIHMGHLQMARSAQAQCMADEVWFLPAGQPWQKQNSALAETADRVRMVELAIEGVHSWRVERVEVDKTEPSYTANTLETLCERHPKHRFSFVIGADQLANLTTWRHWESLFDYARIGVVDRIQWGEFTVPEPLKKHLQHDRLFRIPMPTIQLSSTLLRRQFELLDSPDAQIRETARSTLEAGLPTQVYKYLMAKPIYRPKAV